MTRLLGATLLAAAAAFASTTAPARADDPKVSAILDKAIKALGGEEKLAKARAATWKGKGKITIEGNESDMKIEATVDGLDRYHSTFEGEFNGNSFKGHAVLNGDKGWRKFGDQVMEMDDDAVKNEKRSIYLLVIGHSVLPLKGKGFKAEPAADQNIDGKPAVGLKVTPADGREFTIYFDKESGLPARVVARVTDWMGAEFDQEVDYHDFKDFAGVKRSTRSVMKRDGNVFMKSELTDFKVLDKVPDETFAEPK